jgi:hypothetical protein
MLRFIRGLVQDFENLTEQRGKMRDFFLEGEKHFEAWIKLGLSVIDLFLALAGAGGAQTGVNLVKDATKAIDDLTKKVDSNKGKVAEFFGNSRDIVHEVVGVVVALAVELEKSFKPERVRGFATFLKRVVIPALGNVIDFLGDINNALVEFADTPFGAEFLKLAVAFILVNKVAKSVFGSLRPIFALFAKGLDKAGVFTALSDGLAKIGTLVRPFALLGARLLGIVGIIIGLLAWLGLLDDAWRAITDTFTAFWNEIRPSLARLLDSLRDLWNAVAQGKGAIGVLRDVLKPLVKVFIDLIAIIGRALGRGLGRILGGAIDLISGFVNIITGLLTFDSDKILSGVKTIVKGIGKIMSAIPKMMFEIGKNIGNALIDGFERVAPKVVNAIIGVIEKAFNKSIGGLGVDLGPLGKIKIPEIKLPRMKEAAEDMKDVSKAVDDTATSAKNLKDENLDEEFKDIGKAADKVGEAAKTQAHQNDVATKSITENWKQLRRTNNVTMTQIRTVTERNMQTIKERMGKDSNEARAAIKRNFEKAEEAIRRAMKNGEISTREGAIAIRRNTIRGLKELGLTNQQAEAKVSTGTLQLRQERVPGGGGYRAMGGYVGLPGQRGRDKGSYALGAGEAVLNWAHQKYVAPAVEAFYGHPFSKVFDRVHAYHAGGPGTGFAGGRPGLTSLFDGHPSNVVGGLVSLVRRLKEKFPALVVTSTRDHGTSTSTGGLSDHPSGHAVDVAGPVSAMDEATSFIKQSSIASKLKQGIHNPGLSINRGVTVPSSYWGIAWGQHANHLHLALQGALGNIANVVGGLAPKVARMFVDGPASGLHAMAQRSLNLVHQSAQARVDQIAAMMDSSALDSGSPTFKGAAAPAGQHRNWIRTALRLAGIPASESNVGAQYALDMGESGGDPNITQQIHDINSVSGNLAEGIAQVIPPTFRQYMLPGHGNIKNPIDNIIASVRYQMARYGKLVGHPGYAEGGEIPGIPGQPVPIIAHAKEWVLNEFQQTRLAKMLGTHRHAVRSMLGFHGGPVGFQGGGEVEEITPLSTKEVKGIDPAGLRKLVVILRRIGRNIDSAAVGMGSVEIWSGYLDKSAAQLRRLTRRLGARIGKGDEGKALQGFLDGMDKLLGENGPFAKLRTSIERAASRAATRLSRRSFTVNRRGVVGEGLNEVRVARRTLGQARDLREDLVDERGDITRSLAQVNRQQRRKGLSSAAKQRLQAQENQLRGMLDEAETRIVDNLQSISDAQIALQEAKNTRQQAAVDKINARAEQRLTRNEFARRISEVLGDELGIDKVNQAQRVILERQANALEARLDNARAAGSTELVQQIQNQIADIHTTIVESIQADLRTAADRINARAQRGIGRLDLAGRMLDAVGAVGLGGVATASGVLPGRADLLQQRTGVLQTQRAELTGLRDRAGANIGLIQELNDQIAELTVQIAENTKAQFDAKVDESGARTTFGLNVTDLEKRIIELDGSISGQVDQSKILSNLQKRANILAAQRIELEQFMAEAVANKNQEAINNLTVQLLENEIATKENTVATNELSGVGKTQDFSSSSWLQFRRAIFDGIGNLLPQYAMSVPSAAMGANIAQGGLINVHSGEEIWPAKTNKLATSGAGTTEIKTAVNITNPTEVADPVYLGNAIGWRLANNPNLRP